MSVSVKAKIITRNIILTQPSTATIVMLVSAAIAFIVLATGNFIGALPFGVLAGVIFYTFLDNPKTYKWMYDAENQGKFANFNDRIETCRRYLLWEHPLQSCKEAWQS